jgi:hypothetical protein
MTEVTSEASTSEPSVSTGRPAAVLFGLDDQGKAHAATFESEELEAARKAAGLMDMQMAELQGEDHMAAVAQVPRGRLYATGKAFVPFVKRDLYERLLAIVRPSAAGEGAPTTGQAGEQVSKDATAPRPDAAEIASHDRPPVTGPSEPEIHPLKVAYGRPSDWQAVAKGDLVLAQESLSDGWWEAVIVEQEGDVITLQWRDYPRLPKFLRHREGLALINPSKT